MASRSAICPACGMQFEYSVARGKDRKYCGARCAASVHREAFRRRAESGKKCSVDGCEARVRSPGNPHCERHYARLRRRASLNSLREDSPPPIEVAHSDGYVLEYLPNHELWPETHGRLYQHRRVFFDHHGRGPFNCHWCGMQVTWSGMHVDHVNAVRDDNRIENLVPSCPSCNPSRGAANNRAAKRKSSQVRIEWQGESLCVSEVAERLGVSRVSVKWRMDNNWPIERIMTEPRGKTGPLSKRHMA